MGLEVQRADTRSILSPRSDSSDTEHSVRAAAVVIAVGYVVLLVCMLLIGFALTHVFYGSIGHWDASIDRWFAEHRSNGWNRVTGNATSVVNTLPAIGIAAVISAVLALRHRWREAAMLVIALVLEVLVFLSVTFVIDRPRPDVP